MLTTQTGLNLYTDYLQPLHPASSVLNPIELDAKKTPLALLAQTCSQIGMSDSSSSSKSTNYSKSEPLKISDNSAEEKARFKIYSKSLEKNDSAPSSRDNCVTKAPSVTCRPFTIISPTPSLSEVSKRDKNEKNDPVVNKSSSDASEMIGRMKTTTHSSTSETLSNLGLGLVDSYRSGNAVFHLPQFSGSYASFPQSFLTGLSNRTGTSIMCNDPYCLGYNCTSHLPSTSPLLCSSHVHPSSSSSAFTLIPYGFMLSNEPHSQASQVSAFSSMTGCHIHLPPTLRNLHHNFGLNNRYHPYFRNPFHTPLNSNFSPYRQRLSAPSGLGYQ